MKRRDLADKHCSVARASSQIVDGWTFVILRELFLGNRRFAELQKQSGMSPRSLTLRLRKLEDEGILIRQPNHQGKPAKDYTLTEKGQGLWPVLIMLKQWGDDWCGPWVDGEIPLETEHKYTGHTMRAALVCGECKEPVTSQNVKSNLSSVFQAERDVAASS